MASEYKLSYTASEIDRKLGEIDNLATNVAYVDITDNENVENTEGYILTDAVRYNPQTLTEEQKAQARENIGAATFDKDITNEKLSFRTGFNYPNTSTFDFVEDASKYDYNCTIISETVGGRVTVEWNPTLLTQIEFIPYLFKDGTAYKYAQNSHSGDNRISGDWTPEWINPATGSGFLKIGTPLSFDIPDGCTFMCCFRATYTNGASIVPDGSPYSVNWNDGDAWISKHIQEVISVSVEKTVEIIDVSHKLDKSLGAENANRQMVTNADGEVVPGRIDPHSIALRPGWDTVIHRGWISGAKENTLPAFYLAKENGYSWVECDVRVTSDGVPVLAHDATITGTNESGESVTLTVAETLLSDLQTVVLETHDRFGDIKTNTLAELLDMARVLGMKVLLDIKVSGDAAMKSIAKTVLRYGMSDNVVYMPQGIANAQYIAAVDKSASFSFVCFGTDPAETVDFTAYSNLLTGANTVTFNVQANTWAFDEDVISKINEAGCGLYVWNVTGSTIKKAVDAGAICITKANEADAIDLDAIYLDAKRFWADDTQRIETVSDLAAGERSYWQLNASSEYKPVLYSGNENVAIGVSTENPYSFTDRASNSLYVMPVPEWATKVVVNYSGDIPTYFKFQLIKENGDNSTFSMINDTVTYYEDNTYSWGVGEASHILITMRSADATTTYPWGFDDSLVTVTFSNY